MKKIYINGVLANKNDENCLIYNIENKNININVNIKKGSVYIETFD